MKTVTLIGDSIRMGYQETVRERLANTAIVHGPTENGGSSKNILVHLDTWAISRPTDIVHINCGLHDIRKEFGHDNAAAECVAREPGIPVDDLFGVAQKAGRDKLLQPDGIHFTPDGYALLGKQVAEFISSCNIHVSEPEDIFDRLQRAERASGSG